VSFAGARKFVEQHHGEPAWKSIVASLSESDQATVSSVVAVGWYPVMTYIALLRAIEKKIGGGRLAAMDALGRFQADHDLNVFYRFVLRFWSPAVLIEKTAEFWGRYHDTGTWDVRREGDHRVIGSLSQWAGAEERMCAATVAYIARLFELVGAESPRVQHPECLARGGRRCLFVIDWK
jgi:predicted hydrocarbon binding protein